ncbi:Oxidoreductase FAD/NAD(P)-binding [Trinorchestia longiramus]|nr:Oxidoreductase FAD/NAD(P)-binding [Trinorchestia longiramus]
MNFCVRFGGCIVTRGDGAGTALLRRAGGASRFSGSLHRCCCTSLSASNCNTRSFKTYSHRTAPGVAESLLSDRRLLAMRRAVPSQHVHTSVEWCCKDSIAAVDNRHLVQTAAAPRENVLAKGTVTRVWPASNSVLCFRINVDHPDFHFKAGQWVDVHIPGMEIVGGFSLCSAPHQFAADGSITLGIKRSQWPPVKWFHQNCIVGDTVELRVGGDFFLDLEESPDPTPRLLLVGGGVGVNPLLSMMLHLDHMSSRRPHAMLLFSARTEQDLLYKRELDELCGRNPNLKVRYFVTRTPSPSPLEATTASECHRGRIDRAHLTEALRVLTCAADQGPGDAAAALTATTTSNSCFQQDPAAVSLATQRQPDFTSHNLLSFKDHLKNVRVYICGPPAMINDVEEILLEVGVSKDCLRYEKWW